MDLKSKCLVLFASKYSVTDQKTGVINEGVSIYYYPKDSLDPISTDKYKGEKPLKGTLPTSCFQKITEVPAYYEMSFTTTVKTGANNSQLAVIQPIDISTMVVKAIPTLSAPTK